MNIVVQTHHPNGYKIVLASIITKKDISVTEIRVVQDGALLSVLDSSTRTTYNLAPNSAVLYLFGSDDLVTDSSAEIWINWEASVLQKCVWWYLQSCSAGKKDISRLQALQDGLGQLQKRLSDRKEAFLFGECFGAADVILFSTLLCLDGTNGNILSETPAIRNYVDLALALSPVKEAMLRYYGCEKSVDIPMKSWLSAGPHATPGSLLNSDDALFSLLRLPQSGISSVGQPPAPDDSSSEELRRLSVASLESAANCWHAGNPELMFRTRKIACPVLPEEGCENTLITSALPYVNNVPHLGNIIGCVLSADCFARYCRLRGDNVVYICGTDEYGTATETKAIAEDLTPQQICDKYHKIHSDVYKAFNISFDHFGRTTTKSQEEIVYELFWDLEKAGKIARDSVEQLYCEPCARFLADRFVEGICPHLGCGYDDARGDQCDGCGKLVNAVDLLKPRCKLCSATPQIKTSNHLFIDLPKIEPELMKWFDVSSKKWSHNASVICNSWLRDGLHPRCITRDLKWGVPVPLEGFTDKVFYVWFDAPIGYISITKEYTKDWELWWKQPDKVQLYQFMAKDNVPFHGIIFPCTLTGSPKPWVRVNYIMATEYLNYEDGKFSKSRGVGVFGDQAMQTGIPSDVWRFYLLYLRPESHDTSFSWTDLQLKNNSELLNNLGNFVNRSLKFVSQFFAGVVPECNPTVVDFAVMAQINKELENYIAALNSGRLRDGLRHILSISRLGNLYIQNNEPYKLIKADRSTEEKARGATVIAIATNIVYLLALLLEPYMPDMAARILGFLNKPPAAESRFPSSFCCAVLPGNKVTAPEPLVQKITDEQVKAWQERFKGKCEEKAKPVQTNQANVKNDAASSVSSVQNLRQKVAEQGDKVRALKSSGASKADVASEVTVLLQLKAQLEEAEATCNCSGADVVTCTVATDSAEVERLRTQVTEQGNKVRALKGAGAAKEIVTEEVAQLLRLKEKLTQALGMDPAELTRSAKSKKK